MRVLCIDISNAKHPHLMKPEHWISEGEIYTVTGEYHDPFDGHDYYYLAERMFQPICSYRSTRFVALREGDDDTVEEFEVIEEAYITV